MLTRVVIHRYRSCVDLTLDDLGPTVVLVGRNGSGKTNILRAMETVSKAALHSSEAFDSFIEGASARMEFAAGGRSYSYEVATPWTKNGRIGVPSRVASLPGESVQVRIADGPWRPIAQRSRDTIELPGAADGENRHFQIGSLAPFLPFLVASLPENEPALEDLRCVERYLRAIRYYPLDETSASAEQSRYIPESEYNEWLARFQATGDPGNSIVLKLLHLCLDPDPAAFNEVSALLGVDGLGLVENIVLRTASIGGRKDEETTDATPVPTPPPAPGHYLIWFLLPGYPDSNRANFFEDFSLGTRRIIRLIVSMIFDKASVMLVEHPEDGIHRGLTRQVFSRLKSYTEPMQLIATSHSELVFPLLDPTEVRLVTMEGGVTRARALTTEEVEHARQFVEETGPLADFLETRFGI